MAQAASGGRPAGTAQGDERSLKSSRVAATDLASAEELDLRGYFDTRGAVVSELRRFDTVWLRGGNVFMLRYALARSGADGDLTRLLDEDAIVYSGYSAGPCVLAPTLRGLEAVDGASVVEEVYGDQPIWEGLGVLDYSIVPHVASPEHPESAALGLVAEQYRRFGIPHKTLRDGEVLIIDGTTEFVCR